MTQGDDVQCRWSERDFVRWFEDLLRKSDWQVEAEPRIGPSMRPDLISWDPYGRPYVFEVKTGAGAGHLGSVAQVEAYRNALTHEFGKPARGVLVVASGAPTQLEDVAEAADVLLLRADPEDPSSVSHWLSALPSWPDPRRTE